MKVFIAHASEQKQLATQIAIKLRTGQHTAFLDADSLPPGDSYDDRIRLAVEQCDVFVFLISSGSATPGKYSLTELGYAKQRWPNPQGRILPVVTDEIELIGIDPYLTAVTVLRPVGSAATEVLAAVNAMRLRGAANDRVGWSAILIAGLVLAMVAVLIGSMIWPDGDSADPPGSSTPFSAGTADTRSDSTPTPLDDLAIANLSVVQPGDLTEGWTAFDARTREESIASYEAFSECEAFVPVIRGDDETAIAGRDDFFVDGNTAVSAIVTFYDDAGTARSSGPDLLLDLGYQRCVRAKLRASISATNPTAELGDVASTELPAPSYGQRTEALSHVAAFSIPELGDKQQFTDEWAIQIGRAVLLMTWSSDQEFDPFELELFQTLGSRFERNMALYGD